MFIKVKLCGKHNKNNLKIIIYHIKISNFIDTKIYIIGTI